MNCPNCGKETLPGALFCTGCGCRLDTVVESETKKAGLGTVAESDGASETNSIGTIDAVYEEIGAQTTNDERIVANDAGAASETDPVLPDMQRATSFAQDGIETSAVNSNSAEANEDGTKAPNAHRNANVQARVPIHNSSETDRTRLSQSTDQHQSHKQMLKPSQRPLSTWGFFWREFVFAIPIVNIIVLFVFAFADGVNVNSRAFARARLIYMLIGALILIALGALLFFFSDTIIDWLRVLFRQWYEGAL